ncbi:CapA family protein [Brevibacillus laterosporus]|uniref:CapA family protein n=1 Tax=Brevibacillus laterosporus TaxID=1465 RepID=UPI000B9B98CA|nr:CapA family protein [Brevibacillus laterosporus]
MNSIMTFVATGDYLQTRRVPSYQEPSFQEIAKLIGQADVRLTNLEMHVSYNEGTPNAISGGTHVQTTPDRLEDVVAYGFNVVGTANNHSMDFCHDGLLLTNKYLRDAGLLHTGMGANLFEAGRPVYLDTPSGRVALLSVTSSFHQTHLASEQRRDGKGRPGVNGLRHVKKHLVSQADFEVLKRIASQTEVNALYEMLVEEAFLSPLPEGVLPFGYDLYGYPAIFYAGEKEKLLTMPHEQDMKRLEASIDDATRQADYVIVSFHAHEMKGANKQLPADFVEIASRRFIDAGAHAVVGHGPHTLRGIEIYQNRPIFYSLSNFIFQDETLEVLPQEFYDANSFPQDMSIMQAMDSKTNQGTKGLLSIPEVMESVIASWSMENGQIKEITLYPIELGCGKKRHQNGFPELSRNEAIVKRVAELSKPYGTEIQVVEGIGVVHITQKKMGIKV